MSTNKLYVIKIGGNVLDNPSALELFLDNFASISATKLLVHGGGKLATKIGDQMGVVSNYVDGRRITDEQTIDLVTMVYGGLVNKQLVAQLQHRGCNAIGLTGADGNIIEAIKRPVGEIDYGYVGDITEDDINVPLLHSLLLEKTVPVFAPLTHAQGSMLNTNADTIASTLAIAMSKHYDVRLIFSFEKKGVLLDVNNNDSVITHLSEKKYLDLLTQDVLADGILPKLENAFRAIQKGVHEVVIGDAADLTGNLGKETTGTLITI